MVKEERYLYSNKDKDSKEWFPFFNGVIDCYTIELNLKEGYIIRYKTEKGVILFDDNDNPITEKVYGEVKIIHRKDIDSLTELFEISKDNVTTVLKKRQM